MNMVRRLVDILLCLAVLAVPDLVFAIPDDHKYITFEPLTTQRQQGAGH